MTNEAILLRLAVVLYARGLSETYEWGELLEAIQDQPVDELLLMGENELLDHVHRITLEYEARRDGMQCALVTGVL